MTSWVEKKNGFVLAGDLYSKQGKAGSDSRSARRSYSLLRTKSEYPAVHLLLVHNIVFRALPLTVLVRVWNRTLPKDDPSTLPSVFRTEAPSL